ncbi:MAG: transposase [Treponema sp.]|jgi:hypothetical protein|nr:transposase [Treponema sp.]
MEENKRLYLLSEELFNQKVVLIIEGRYIWKGCLPTVFHYKVFCDIRYILRTGCPWRDLPPEYRYWQVIYDWFLMTVWYEKSLVHALISVCVSKVAYGGGTAIA